MISKVYKTVSYFIVFILVILIFLTYFVGTTGDSNLDVWGRYHQKIYWRIFDYAIIGGFGYIAFILSEKANSKKNNS